MCIVESINARTKETTMRHKPDKKFKNSTIICDVEWLLNKKEIIYVKDAIAGPYISKSKAAM